MQNNEFLMGNVKKELDMQSQNGTLQEHWTNRGFYSIKKCKLELRRTAMRNNFQHRVKLLNGIMPTHKKMRACDKNHSKICPRRKKATETWQHVLKCEKKQRSQFEVSNENKSKCAVR